MALTKNRIWDINKVVNRADKKELEYIIRMAKNRLGDCGQKKLIQEALDGELRE